LASLAQRLPVGEVFLANIQAGSNVYYFQKSQWEVDRAAVIPRIQAMPVAPRFVLWGDDCRRQSEPALEALGYTREFRLNDWTFGEYADNQRRPCFLLYERHTR